MLKVKLTSERTDNNREACTSHTSIDTTIDQAFDHIAIIGDCQSCFRYHVSNLDI